MVVKLHKRARAALAIRWVFVQIKPSKTAAAAKAFLQAVDKTLVVPDLHCADLQRHRVDRPAV